MANELKSVCRSIQHLENEGPKTNKAKKRGFLVGQSGGGGRRMGSI